MEVSRALPEESAALTQIALNSKRHWNYPESWIQIWLPLLTISPEYLSENETWVAIVGGQPVAYYSLKYDDQDLWLDNLWVLPDFTSQGVGSFLFNHAIERSRECGAVILKIEADPHAQGFYEKMGARKIAEHYTTIEGQPRTLPVMEINIADRLGQSAPKINF